MRKFDDDYKRYFSAKRNTKLRKAISIIHDPVLRSIFLFRLAETKKGRLRKTLLKRAQIRMLKKGIEVSNMDNIDGGLCFAHPYGITINSRAHIGRDFTIFKGATVGSIRSGKRMGTPIIGDRVTICSGAFVCGGITVGNDVLVAANAFVNFDVPDNSIVIGNPGVIKHKCNPSADYLAHI